MAIYALRIKLVGRTSAAHSFNPYAYFGHSWSYFDIQNLQLVILYIIYSTRLIFDDILHRKFDKYRITANIIVSITVSMIGQTVVLVILYVKTFKTNVNVFI